MPESSFLQFEGSGGCLRGTRLCFLTWQSSWRWTSHCWCQRCVLHGWVRVHKLGDHQPLACAVNATPYAIFSNGVMRHAFRHVYLSLISFQLSRVMWTLIPRQAWCWCEWRDCNSFGVVKWTCFWFVARQAWRCKHLQLVWCGEMNLFLVRGSTCLAVQTPKRLYKVSLNGRFWASSSPSATRSSTVMWSKLPREITFKRLVNCTMESLTEHSCSIPRGSHVQVIRKCRSGVNQCEVFVHHSPLLLSTTSYIYITSTFASTSQLWRAWGLVDAGAEPVCAL